MVSRELLQPAKAHVKRIHGRVWCRFVEKDETDIMELDIGLCNEFSKGRECFVVILERTRVLLN